MIQNVTVNLYLGQDRSSLYVGVLNIVTLVNL